MRKILQRHRGADNPITMTQLFTAATGEQAIPTRRYDQTRIIRSLVEQLRRDGVPIANRGGKTGGYYLAENEAELDGTIRNFHNRAMSSLQQEAALKRIDINQLFEQYKLELTQQEQNHDSTHKAA